MRITVRLFASLREAAGRSQLEMDVAPGATLASVGAAVTRVLGLDPRLLDGARPAVNLEYAGYDDVLREGDEVAFIPPVAGG